MKNFLLFLIIISALISLFAIFSWRGIYLPKDADYQIEKTFVIKKGEGTREIAFNLEKEGLIQWGPLFRLYALSKGTSGNLQAGEYLLSPSMTVPEIAEKFIEGETTKEKITIIEGWNLRNIGWYFENKGMFQAEELFELVGFPLVDYSRPEGARLAPGGPSEAASSIDLPRPKDFSADFSFLEDKPEILGLEGYLFPDTYELNKGESLEDIVRKILYNFDKKLAPESRKDVKNQEKSIFEIVSMASLIEKEVRSLEDKKMVSGILWKRLKAGMPLQVDATIAYITGKQTTKISADETRIDSPYNTYKYPGLPLGPICNPGLESILASIYPEDSEYWYYLSTPEGQTIFSKTLEEHNIAKAKYLK